MARRRRRRVHHRGGGLFSIGAKELGRIFKIATRTGVKIAKNAGQQAMKKARDINTWRKLTKKGIKSGSRYGTLKLLNSQTDKDNHGVQYFRYVLFLYFFQSVSCLMSILQRIY